MAAETNPREVEISGAETHREEFGASETTAIVETASSAVAAQARAAVQSRYVMALQRPRDWDTVRVRLLKECRRPGFAEAAIYHKPIGEGVEGPSIRFAEAALRCMGNALPEVTTVYDDDAKRILRVSVTELESNLTYSKDVTIQKTVERRKLVGDQVPLSSRYNSRGQQIYIVPATDDDILNKENALVSKALRTLALRVLPGDILDECMELVRATRAAKIKEDPDAARRKLIDAFVSIGVQPEMLREYLGHEVRVEPAELDKLRAIYAAIKDGELSWTEVLASVSPPSDGDPEAESKAKAQAEAVQEKLRAAREKRDAAKKPAAEGGAKS